jgi:hypothetical protein
MGTQEALGVRIKQEVAELLGLVVAVLREERVLPETMDVEMVVGVGKVLQELPLVAMEVMEEHQEEEEEAVAEVMMAMAAKAVLAPEAK